MLYDPLLDVLALAVGYASGTCVVPLVESSPDLFLLFLRPLLLFPCSAATSDLAGSLSGLVLTLPLPLKVPLDEAVVTLALGWGMLSLAATTKALSGKGPSTLSIGTFSLCCQQVKYYEQVRDSQHVQY